MRLPVDGDINKITARYFQFGGSPYSFQVVNPDGSLFPRTSGGAYRHHGMDLDVKEGTPIKAPEDGRVLFSGNAGSAGNMVQIQGRSGIVRMLHNSRNVVRTGQTVKLGQLVAYSGKTGFSAGIPHVHFDLERGRKYVDPRPYIKVEEEDMADPKMTTAKLNEVYQLTEGRNATKAEIDKYVHYEVYSFMLARLNTIVKRWKAAEANSGQLNKASVEAYIKANLR